MPKSRLSLSPELQEKPSGGLGALIESDPIESAPQEESRKPGKPLPTAPEIRFEKAIQRWQEYDGNLLLVENENPILPDRPSSAPDRISSVSMALLVHAVVFFLIGLVAITAHAAEAAAARRLRRSRKADGVGYPSHDEANCGDQARRRCRSGPRLS